MSYCQQDQPDRAQPLLGTVQNSPQNDQTQIKRDEGSEGLETPCQKPAKQEQQQNLEEFPQNYHQMYEQLNSGMYEVRQQEPLSDEQPPSSRHFKQTENKHGQQPNHQSTALQDPPINQQAQHNRNQENAMEQPAPPHEHKVLQELLQQRLGIKHSDISYPSIEAEVSKIEYQQVESQEEGTYQKQAEYQEVLNMDEQIPQNKDTAQEKQEPRKEISHSEKITSRIAKVQVQSVSQDNSITEKRTEVQEQQEPTRHSSVQTQITNKLDRQSTNASEIHFDQVNIIGYDKTFFLKIQTQIYQIEVKLNRKVYTIKRRFMDFSLLYKLALLQFPGYILYPFPRKTLQLFKQLKFSIGDQAQKMVSIEKRILQLQKFLQFLIAHKEIGQSRLISSFLTEEHALYTIVMTNLQNKINEQEKEFDLGILVQNYNSLKSMVAKGFSLFQYYVQQSQSRPHQSPNIQQQLQIEARQLQVEYQPIKRQLAQCKESVHHLYQRADRLRQIYKSNSQVCNIESNIDSILILSSKLTSSKSYYERQQEWIEDNILLEAKHYIALFEQIEEQIVYRNSLLSKIGHSAMQTDKMKRIIQKVKLFDSRFLPDWSDNLIRFKHSEQDIYKQFAANWKKHCLLMSKIWK